MWLIYDGYETFYSPFSFDYMLGLVGPLAAVMPTTRSWVLWGGYDRSIWMSILYEEIVIPPGGLLVGFGVCSTPGEGSPWCGFRPALQWCFRPVLLLVSSSIRCKILDPLPACAFFLHFSTDCVIKGKRLQIHLYILMDAAALLLLDLVFMYQQYTLSTWGWAFSTICYLKFSFSLSFSPFTIFHERCTIAALLVVMVRAIFLFFPKIFSVYFLFIDYYFWHSLLTYQLNSKIGFVLA